MIALSDTGTAAAAAPARFRLCAGPGCQRMPAAGVRCTLTAAARRRPTLIERPFRPVQDPRSMLLLESEARV
jgi:hypothetical protein